MFHPNPGVQTLSVSTLCATSIVGALFDRNAGQRLSGKSTQGCLTLNDFFTC
jgi:hypothetical protein